MKFSVDYVVDPANKLLICEAKGEVEQIIDLQHMIKNTIKIAGKNQVKNVVLDVTAFKIHCDTSDVTYLMNDIKDQGLLDDMKIARLIVPNQNVHNVIVSLAETLGLSIKNFESRSQAMLWLLFDKAPTEN